MEEARHTTKEMDDLHDERLTGMAEPTNGKTATMYIDPNEATGSILDYKKDKFKALFQARYILAKHGNMEERRICKRQLDRMKKLGIHSV